MKKSLIAIFFILLIVTSSAWATDYVKQGTVTLPYGRYNHNLTNQMHIGAHQLMLLSMITNSSERIMNFHIDLYGLDGSPVGRFPYSGELTINGHGSYQIDWNKEFEEGNPNLNPLLEECSAVIVWKGKIDTPPVILGDLLIHVNGIQMSNSISVYQSQY